MKQVPVSWEPLGSILVYTQKKENISINSIITMTHCSRIIHFAIKRRRDTVKEKTSNVNEDTIGAEIVTFDQPVNIMQGTFSCAEPGSGCTKIFQKYSNLKSHILFGKHYTFFNSKSAVNDIKNKLK
jgi:hypothetical protein